MFKKIAAGYRNAGIMIACSAPFMAFAQETDPFVTAATAVKTKAATYATELVVIAAVSVGFLVAVKYVKKIRGAA